jgi:collagen triple helix repeat protein
MRATHWLFLFFILGCALLAQSAHAQVVVTDDAYLTKSYPSTNFGAKTALSLVANSPVYLKFDVSAYVKAGVKKTDVPGARLQLFVGNVTAEGTFRVCAVNGDWNEVTVTYNFRPAYLCDSNSIVVPITLAQKNTFLNVEGGALAASWLDGTNYGLALVPDATINVTFDSKENSTTAHEPQLTYLISGPQGPSGPQGGTGPIGPQGLKGDTGAQGLQGIQGLQGLKGDTGAAGQQGPKGDTGATGPQGLQGIQGPQGLKGDTGAVGQQGPKGDTGATGPQGLQGVQGPQGQKGDTGATGPQGPQGLQGPVGVTGSPGAKGDTGATGPQGPGFAFLQAFDATKAYAINDVVTFNGSSYVATAASETKVPPDSNPNPPDAPVTWSVMAAKGDAGASGVTSVSAPLTGNGSGGSPLALPQASSVQNGYLSSAHWAAFNSKLDSVSHDSSLSGSGTGADQLKVASVADSLLSTNVALRNAVNDFAAAQTITTTAPGTKALVISSAGYGISATGSPGVFGKSTVANGIGINGQADNGTGATGVYGGSDAGYGTAGISNSGFGLYGDSGGIAGVFHTWGSGRLLSGRVGGGLPPAQPTEVFSVDGTGKVSAVSFAGDGSLLTNVPAAALGGTYVNQVNLTNTNNILTAQAVTVRGPSTIPVWGESTAANGVGVYGVSNTGGDAKGVWGYSSSGEGVWGKSASTYAGVHGTSADGNGVYGESTNSSGVRGESTSGSGVFGTGLFNGVYGSSSGSGTGVYGENTGDGNGVRGYSYSGSAVLGTTVSGYAGYFAGKVSVTGNLNVGGNLSKASGSFKIDHPLDPANKYLYHSFVESPDMMNIYNGVVVLNKRGEAWVNMPEWFEMLNQDYRYQLTSIGRFMPVYIAREISGNRFKIAGGKPGAKISWQVTGIRHDAYANDHRIRVEEEKPAAERGSYLYPEGFGQSARRTAAKSAPESAGKTRP